MTGPQLIRQAVRQRIRPCLNGTVGGILYAVALVAMPIPAGRLVDKVLVEGDSSAIPMYLVIFGFIALLRGGGGALRRYEAFRLSLGVSADLRERLYEHCQRLSLVFHDRVGAGDLMSRASADIAVVEQLTDVIPYMVQTLVLWIAGTVAMILIDWRLGTAVAVIFVPALVWAISRGRNLDVMSGRVQAAMGDYGRFVEESVGGIRIIKGFGLDRQRAELAGEKSDAVSVAGEVLARRRAAFVGWVMATPAATILIVVGFGGWLSTRGHLSEGDLFAFLQYVIVLGGPVRFAGHNVARARQAFAGAGRIAEVLAVEPAPPWHGSRLPKGAGRLVFDGVSFGYHRDNPILRGVSFAVEGGRSAALVGASGVGKSTLLQLVPRFYEPWSGTISLDGVDVASIEPRALRRAVSLVFQDTVLFTGSLWDNIALGDDRAGDDDVRRAAEVAGAAPFIDALPDGYDTIVGERGLTLSGGQRQRLAIARALLRKPRVLLLDDPMSAVDAATQQMIHAGLRRIIGGTTTLIVTNHLPTIELVDEVVFLADGRIAARGPHEELLGLERYRDALALSAQPV
ncbi:MAG TPA: ABC transporter ATP-binding protein [Acidimicrobiales bacterium]|nr:ABC transporter ATP-binding protein [Acidimicrobiales bacterium]